MVNQSTQTQSNRLSLCPKSSSMELRIDFMALEHLVKYSIPQFVFSAVVVRVGGALNLFPLFIRSQFVFHVH